MPQKNDTSTQRTEKGGTLSLRRGLAAAAALPRAVLRCRSFFKSLFSKGEDRPLPQRTLLAAAICLPLAAICLSTVTENAFFIQWEERGRGMDKAYAALRCRLSAGLGDVEAQFRLGKLYAEGHGLPRDEEKSLFWYGEAAEQGHAGAQRYLAFEAYSLTWAEMARWRQKLADQGDVRAKCLLGDMYAKGRGVPQDKAKAACWYRKAALRGHDEAAFELGSMYAAGDGVPQDKALAAEWFRKAAEQGHGEARFRLGGMYAAGDGVPQDKAEAAYWYRKAALRGHDEAAFELGSMYAAGDGVPQDKAEVACWYRKAAEQKNVRAQWRLGNMYAAGDGVPQDKAEAAVWYRKAAEQDDVEAQKALAHMYHTGDGIPRDVAQAIHWYRKLAERREDKEAGAALNTLGKIYAAGDGVPRDMAQAVRCFREAALREDDEAPSQLARLYAAGDGVPRDMGKALLWQHWALWRGDEHALPELARLHAGGDGLPCDTPLAAAWYYRLCEEVSQSADALDALRTLGVDLADLRKYTALIHRLLRIRMTAARAELALEAAETDLTARGKVRMAALCAALVRLVPDPAAELASLEADGRKHPPIIRQMVAAVFAGATAIEREVLFTLGRMYDTGDGVPRDLYESLYCYHQGAGLGDGRAQAELTRLIPDLVPSPGTAGEARPKDNDMASDLLAEGYALWNGDGMPEDREQAVARFYKAMEYGSAEAARILIRCSFLGKGTQESDADTMFYLFMYEALRDETKPLPKIEAALRRYCDQTLSPKVVQEQWQRRNDVFSVIRQRVWF